MDDEEEKAPLTVGRLMELLAAATPDALVVIPGYEGGLNTVLGVSAGPVRREQRGWYYGEWWPARDVESGEERAAVALAPGSASRRYPQPGDCDLSDGNTEE